jgi:hypothetical protein
MTIKSIEPNDYPIAMQGSPWLHENLAWFATDDDEVLGVLLRDKVDHDFSWVILTQNDQGPGYTAVELDHSKPTADVARRELHTAMEEWKVKGGA